MGSKTVSSKRRIFLVDDHCAVRQSLAALIQSESDLIVCGEAEDTNEALTRIPLCQPHLVLLDLSLKRSNGMTLLDRLNELQHPARVLVVSMHDEIVYAERVLRAGAFGYISKQDATSNILPAIRRVLNGQHYFSPQMSARLGLSEPDNK